MNTAIDTGRILEKHGYTYIFWETPGEEPEYSDKKFKDVIPEFSRDPLGNKHLYKHQYQGYLALREGKNVILRSGTGSGKTEVWILHTLEKIKSGRDYRVLVIYPTIALANDQVKRINRYSSLAGIGSLQLDGPTREKLVSVKGFSGVRRLVAESRIIASNPAYLLHELKKAAVTPTRSLLYPYLQKLDLLVIDELDFYDPRSLSLLLAMIKIISIITDKQLQVAVLTATLENPDDLGRYLEEVTGREYVVIHGKPFSIPNKNYIVLGKDLKKIWLMIKGILEKEAERTEEEVLVKSSRDYEYFTRNLYRVLGLLEALGYDPPSPTINTAEIISYYTMDNGVTLIFTRSIASAEETARQLKTILGDESLVATHHHLVSKKYREIVEEKARKGELKIIVTPKTLSQGIDIGTVKRVVHLGLPDNVREYYQREGRKGRRKELGFSETLIIPYTRWDRELLSRGVEVFKKWLSLGLEKTIINPENHYLHLFTAVLKLKSPWLPKTLGKLEREALEKTGILRGNKVNEELLDYVYTRLNFYEFAPPYGIKRILVKNREEVQLEPIGHCDLVEKFQPGCIDYSENSVVTRLKTGRNTRTVTAVIEEPLKWELFRKDDALAVVLEEYRYNKMKWGEESNIIKDFLHGRLTCEEICVVYVPSNGFGKYRKIPNRCLWRVKSRRPRLLRLGNRSIIYYDKATIVVPKNGAGEYRDYTYGFRYDVDPRDDPELLRLGLAYLMIILRRKLGIPFETIMYDIVRIGEDKYFNLHEPQSAALITMIDWSSIRRIIEEYEPDELDEILLQGLDDIAYSTYITIGGNWNIIKQYMKRITDYILLREKLRLVIGGKEIIISKPSPAQKLVALKIFAETIDKPTSISANIIGIAYYDGEEEKAVIDYLPAVPYIKPSRETLDLVNSIIEKIMYEDYRIIVDDVDRFYELAGKINLKTLQLIPQDRLVGLKDLAGKAGIDPLSVNILFEKLGLSIQRKDPAKTYEYLSKLIDHPGNKTYRKIIAEYLVGEAVKNYYLYLVLEAFSREKTT